MIVQTVKKYFKPKYSVKYYSKSSTDKVAVITGGSRGIGFAIAQNLVNSGHTVAGIDFVTLIMVSP